MVNYVLSFCKITGASKIFKRNFYLPLLKPLTPKDALRTLRITGKWLLGNKKQHYIPVLLHHTKKRSKMSKNYGKKQHEKLSDFTYMAPVIDPENDTHKLLLKILETKEKSGQFAYTVDYKKYNIIFDSDFEEAIRKRDIIDILVSHKNDKIIVKLKDRKKILIELQYFEGAYDNLISGEGATTAEDEKFHHYGKYTMSLAEIFEEKEVREEKWEEELKKILKRRKKQKWENSKAYKEMMKRNMKNLDWQKFEEEAKKLIQDIDEPVTEKPIEMEVDNLDATKNVNETILSKGSELINQLPTLTEIPDIIKHMGNASLHEIESSENDVRKVSGVKVKLPSGKECFVSGQMVLTEEGEVFVPGQTVQNEYGDEYVPGITTNINNKPTLIGGLIVGEEERDPLFLPSQSAITADGQLTFATVPEERPPPLLESERKLERRKKEEPLDVCIIIEQSSCDESSDTEEKSTDMSMTELNNFEIDEDDLEAIRIRQEQHRLELEKLKQQLFDDMDDIISSLEEKKRLLNEKLEQLRQQHINDQVTYVTYVSEKDTLKIASKLSSDNDAINRISDALLTIIRRASTFTCKNSIRIENIHTSYLGANASDSEVRFHASSNKLKILFKSALVAANNVFLSRPKDQLLALNAVADILVEPFTKSDRLLEEFVGVMKTKVERSNICDVAFKQLQQVIEDNKVAILNMLVDKQMPVQDTLESVAKMLGNDHIMATSFAKIAKLQPQVLQIMVQRISEQGLKNITVESDALQVLRKSITLATKEIMFDNLNQIKTGEAFPELIEDAASFAKALSMDELVDDLSRPRSDFLLDETVDMLMRMVLIRKLAERDFSLKSAIVRIKKNPECAKSDPRIRQLVRESAVLISDQLPVLNSRCIPLLLMKTQNVLAIEDFLVKRTEIEYPVLISRGALQAVIPKDASRGVLAGRVAYVLIDESGVTNLKPMHVKSAIPVNKNREKRIDDYLSGVRNNSVEREDNPVYLKAKSNVRKLKKLFHSNRNAA